MSVALLQLLYTVVIYAWVGGLLGITFYAMKFAGFLRVSPEVEAEVGAGSRHWSRLLCPGMLSGLYSSAVLPSLVHFLKPASIHRIPVYATTNT